MPLASQWEGTSPADSFCKGAGLQMQDRRDTENREQRHGSFLFREKKEEAIITNDYEEEKKATY